MRDHRRPIVGEIDNIAWWWDGALLRLGKLHNRHLTRTQPWNAGTGMSEAERKVHKARRRKERRAEQRAAQTRSAA